MKLKLQIEIKMKLQYENETFVADTFLRPREQHQSIDKPI